MDKIIRLEKQIGGWRHFIGEDEIRCGDIVQIYNGSEWIAGRYEAEGLNVPDKDPHAFIWFDESNYTKLPCGVVARFPKT